MAVELEARRDGGCVVLASGGIESTTLLHRLARKGGRIAPVFFHYGQRPSEREHRAARAQCRELGLELEVLDIAGVTPVFQAGQERRYHIPLPHRNLVALSLGLSLAEKRGADRLLIGTTGDDADLATSASRPFLDAFRGMAGLLGPVSVEAPFQEMGKDEVVREGLRLGVDFGRTYSCLLGRREPCGSCPQCRKRRSAFQRAGVPEPRPALDPGEA
ncbi:MAG: 7-cyano-7-deazaguanine synthase [Thiohalorhabdus sp.]